MGSAQPKRLGVGAHIVPVFVEVASQPIEHVEALVHHTAFEAGGSRPLVKAVIHAGPGVPVNKVDRNCACCRNCASLSEANSPMSVLGGTPVRARTLGPTAARAAPRSARWHSRGPAGRERGCRQKLTRRGLSGPTRRKPRQSPPASRLPALPLLGPRRPALVPSLPPHPGSATAQ
jgi:hypothetical protein